MIVGNDSKEKSTYVKVNVCKQIHQTPYALFECFKTRTKWLLRVGEEDCQL